MTHKNHLRPRNLENQSLRDDLQRIKATYQSIAEQEERQAPDEEISIAVPRSPRMTHLQDAHKGKRKSAEMQVDNCSLSCTML